MKRSRAVTLGLAPLAVAALAATASLPASAAAKPPAKACHGNGVRACPTSSPAPSPTVTVMPSPTVTSPPTPTTSSPSPVPTTTDQTPPPTTAPPADPEPVAPVAAHGPLTFADEMDGPVAGVATCFADHPYPCTHGDSSGDWAEAQCYLNGNVTYANGLAALTARQETATCEGTTKAYTSGLLDFSATAATAQYGVWEVRAQVPNVSGKDSVGFWPAIWNPPLGCWPPEPDQMEIFGGSSTGSTGAMLVGADGKLHPQRFTVTYHDPANVMTSRDYYGPGGPGSTDWSAGFHTWTYESRPGVQRFYVDSTLVMTVNRDWVADVHAKCPSASGKSELLINLALRSKYASWLPAEVPATMWVDSARYWS